LSQQPTNTTSQNDTNTATGDVEDFVFQDSEDHIIGEMDYAKHKLRLAENWTEIQDELYTSTICANTLHDADCFFCNNPVTIKCNQCGPYYMCLQCCLLYHTNCNIHHCPEEWKVGICSVRH